MVGKIMILKSMRMIGIVSILTLTNTLSAQNTFENVYGGDMDDQGWSVQQIPDGGYIIVGQTGYSFGGTDVYLIKTDGFGDTVWTKTFGSLNYDDIGTCVQNTSDQGYIITGYKVDQLIPSSADLLLIKADSDGDQVWVKTFDYSVREYGHSVRQTSDGGYIIAGSINVRIMGGVPQDEYDVFIIKTDSSGTELWTKTYQNLDQSHGYCLQQTSDGGYVIAGRTGSYTDGISDMYLIKTDASGDVLWTKTYGGSGYDCAYSVQQNANGDYIIAGYTDSYASRGEYDISLIKTDSSGKMQWTRIYGGPYADYCTSMNLTSDEGCIISGHTKSFVLGNLDAYLIRTYSSGDTMWTRTYGGSGDDRANFVQQTSDGGYIFAGSTDSKGAGSTDVYVIKTNEYGMVTDIEKPSLQDKPASFHLAQNFPNPFNPKTVISYQLPVSSEVDLRIYNLLGQKLVTLISEKQPTGTYRIEWDASGFASGVYFYRLETDKGFTQAKKLILLK